MVAKAATKAKYTCQCGTRVTKGYAYRHDTGEKHQGYLRSQNTGDTDNPVVPRTLPDFTIPDLTDVSIGFGPYPKPEVVAEVLPLDLQSIIDCKDSPILKAKSLRQAFSARGWPNPDHEGTVQDFMDQYNIPYYGWDKGDSLTERRQRVIAWEKEQIYGKL